MPRSSPLRNNPFVAQGLHPGMPLQLMVTAGDDVETVSTLLEEIRPGALAVALPMRGLAVRPLPAGAVVHASYTTTGRRFRFVTEVQGYDPEGDGQLLALPAAIEQSDRRRSFRLATMLHPTSVYRLVLDAKRDEAEGRSLRCTIVDLSEGGVCLSTRTRTEPGEWLGLVTNLAGDSEVRARMRVVEAAPPAPGHRTQRAHCEFVALPRHERDKIARFLMRRQLAMRRDGRL